MTLNCIVCNKQLESATPGETNQPYGGTTFTTRGHYGSTVFDPMDGSFLEINICDECLTRAGERKQVLVAQTTVHVKAPVPISDDKYIYSIIGHVRGAHAYAPVEWQADLPGLDLAPIVIENEADLDLYWDRIETSFSKEHIVETMLRPSAEIDRKAETGENHENRA